MSREINFLRKQNRKLTELQQRDKLWLKYASFVFAGVLIISLISVGTNFYFQFQISRAHQRITELEDAIMSREDVEKSAVITSQKLKVISELFNQRQDKQLALEYFTNLFGEKVLVKDIQYKEELSILSLNIEAKDVFVIERVLTLLTSADTVSRYPLLALSDLRRDDQGVYSMDLTITLEKPDLPVRKLSPKPSPSAAGGEI